MSERFDNPLLSAVMRRIRHPRQLLPAKMFFYNRVERSRGGNYIEVWFMTAGCQWDAQGGCTMCNYGRGHTISEDEIVDAVRQGLDDINVDVSELVVSPSGSMLDPREVPVGARRRIFSLISDFPAPQFVFETRPETVTPNAVKEFGESVLGKRLGVEMGLESSNAWVQRFCINKGSHPNQFIRAAEILFEHGVDVYANVSLGTAFLSSSEAINDAVNSIRWAFDNGADIAVLFPLHVKPYTLLAWLYERDLYHPPSLWSLVEALRQLGTDFMDRTEISWYRSYYDDDSKIVASPTTCHLCRKDVLKLLDEYRDSRSPSAVEQLYAIQCECKDTWRKELGKRPTTSLPERVLAVYKKLARQFLSADWWNLHGHALQRDLFGSFSGM